MYRTTTTKTAFAFAATALPLGLEARGGSNDSEGCSSVPTEGGGSVATVPVIAPVLLPTEK